MSITTTPQSARVYAIFDNPPTVLACRVNQTFKSHDKVVSFKYDGVSSGSYTNVKAGMTILLGSSAGAHDKGITYARKSPSATDIYVGETSEVAWADNLYVTVLQDFGIWPEYPSSFADGTLQMKHDVAYSDQHSKMAPIPILGPDRVVFFASSSVSVSFDGSNSYVYGSTIASHAFTCSGGSISGGSTATPTITLSAVGRYLLTYTVTSALGASATTYRTIHVVDSSLLTDVRAGNLVGSAERGGWEFSLNSLGSTITARERTKVILVSEEWYGSEKISYGPVAGAENIIAIGWLENEGILLDEEKGEVSFSVKGPHFWLQQMHNFVPLGVRSVSGTPTAWTQISALTVDKMLWHMLIWRSTAFRCIDIFLSGNTLQATELVAPAGKLWDQIKSIAYESILATPMCDRYGRLFVQTEMSLMPLLDRETVSITAVSGNDWESISVERSTVTNVSQVILSGVAVSGSDISVRYSLSPGHIPEHYGATMQLERLLLSTQELANELAGNLLEKANAPYRFNIKNLLYNNRTVDICPRQSVSLAVSAADNLRGISYNGKVIVKGIELRLENGAWDIDWMAEQETQARLSVDGDIPVKEDPPDDNFPKPDIRIPIPKYPPIRTPWTWRPSPPPPIEYDPPSPVDCPGYSPETKQYRMYWSRSWLDGDPTVGADKRSAYAIFPCVIRPLSTHDYPTEIDLGLMLHEGEAVSHLHLYAIDRAKTRLAEATLYTKYEAANPDTQWWGGAKFDILEPIAVDGFELYLEEGLDAEELNFTLNSHTPPSSGGFYSSTTLFLDEQVIFLPGVLGYHTWFTGTNTNPFAGAEWSASTVLTVDAGAYAPIWCFLTSTVSPVSGTRMPNTRAISRWTTTDTVILDTENLVVSQALIMHEFTADDLYKRQRTYSIKYKIPDGSPANNQFVADLYYYFFFSSTYPVRKISFGAPLIMNVCRNES